MALELFAPLLAIAIYARFGAGTYTTVMSLLVAYATLLCSVGLWSEYVTNPLRKIPRLRPDWQTRLFRWIYTEPTPSQLLEWIADTPNNGLLRYHGIGGKPRVLLTNAEVVKEVFVTQQYTSFEKPELIRLRTGNNIGFGLSATTGDVHKLQRRKMMPALNLQTSRSFTPLFWDKTCELISALNEHIRTKHSDASGEGPTHRSGLIDVPRWASRVTIDSIGPGILGKSFDSIQNPKMPFYDDYKMLAELSMSATKIVLLAMVIPMNILAKLPLQVNRDQRRAVVASRRVCVEALEEHRQYKDLAQRRDVLSLALKSDLFDNEELINHMGNLLGAGHETTAFQISYTCLFLCQHPEMQERLRLEVRSALPSPSSGQSVGAKTLEALPFLQAVVNESLRLLPAATGIYRTALRDTIVAGHSIPAGTNVAAFGLVNHYLECNWGPDAAAFTPERWLKPGQEQLGGAKSPYDLISFSVGPRNCPGAAFAKQELLAVVAGLVGCFKLELDDPAFEPRFRYNVSLAPAGGLEIRFTPLDGW